MNENVNIVIRIPAHQVAGKGFKRHIAPVGGDECTQGAAIPLRAVRSQRDARRPPALPVVDKNITIAIRIPAHQVISKGHKSHVAPVGGNGWSKGVVAPLRAVGGHRDSLRPPALPVVDENVPSAICIPAHQVAGSGLKRHVAPVGGDGWII